MYIPNSPYWQSTIPFPMFAQYVMSMAYPFVHNTNSMLLGTSQYISYHLKFHLALSSALLAPVLSTFAIQL